jgi:hypothetical protein
MESGPRRTRTRARWLWAVVAASFVPAAYFGLMQAHEDRVVDDYLRERGLIGLPANEATALRVSHTVRADFETDSSKWKSYRLAERPFLRRGTEWLLHAREGWCGEGTRVMVNLMGRLGIDATRVTLYDSRLRGMHTLVSVRVDGRERLVDSINTPDDLNAYLDRAALSTANFRVLHYNDDIVVRHALGAALSVRDTAAADSDRTAFFTEYCSYSYEAVPLTKLFARAGFDWRVLNLTRPPRWVSSLAEKPRAIKAVVSLALALVFDAALLLASRGRAD